LWSSSQLGEVRRHQPRLVLGEQLGRPTADRRLVKNRYSPPREGRLPK
jgi:hypothetical protein